MHYKAFISYSHAADNQLAPSIQSALQRFAKPFYRLPTINVFRDKTSLQLTPELWPLIQKALRESEYFILMASPEAAMSRWVNAEIDEWLALKNGSVQNCVIVLTDGEILWDSSQNDFDWNKTTALPLNLRDRFKNEPLYLDLRWAKTSTDLSLRHPQFLDDIGTIAATLHGKSKDVMVGRDVREHRIFKAAAASAILVLLISVVGVTIAAYYANEQRRFAEEKSRVALSRQLATQATTNLENQFDLTLLLGVEAAGMAPTFEARSMLRSALERNPTLMAYLEGHQSAIHGVAFSPDGKVLASAGLDDAIRLWDVTTRRPIGNPLVSDIGGIWSLAFSSDGKTLAVGGPQAIALWDVSSQTPSYRRLIPARYNTLHSLAFSPSGKVLASGGGDITLWDVATARPIGEPLTSQATEVWSVAFSPDGNTLAAGEDKKVVLWDVATHEMQGIPLTDHRSDVFSVAFSRDGKSLASGDSDGIILLWNLAARIHRPPLDAHTWIRSLSFGADDKTLISAGDHGKLARWYIVTDSPVSASLEVSNSDVLSIAVDRDGKTFASGDANGTLILWGIGTDRSLARALPHSSVSKLEFSPDDRTLALGTASSAIRLVDLNTDSNRDVPLTSSVHDFAFNRDGRILAAVEGDDIVFLSVASGQVLGKTPSQRNAHSLAFSPDGTTLAVGVCGEAEKSPYRGQQRERCVRGEVRMWNTETNQPLGARLVDDDGAIEQLMFSPDGKTLASVNEKVTFDLWDVATGQRLWSASGGSVAFSPDGRTLAHAEEQTITLWDIRTHRKLNVFPSVFRSEVKSIAFSRDGRMLASSSTNEFVLWDVGTRQPLWLDHTGTAFAFSRDSKLLATVRGGRVMLWDVDLKSWSARACAVANRNLTIVEWRQYYEDEPYRKTCEANPIHPSFLDEGKRLAKDGASQEALAIFRRALSIEPTVPINPSIEVQRLMAVGKGEKLLSEMDKRLSKDSSKRTFEDADETEKLMSLYRGAVAAYDVAMKYGATDLHEASSVFNTMCWRGSLNGHAAGVMDACQRAAENEPKSARFRDSRGLARALSGDSRGAVEDFVEFVKSTDDDAKGSRRRRWIEVLKAGENPFTPEELAALREE